MFFEKWMTKALAIGAALLAVFGLVKASNKKAADAREDEVNLEAANKTIENVKVKQNVQSEVNNYSNDDAANKLRE